MNLTLDRVLADDLLAKRNIRRAQELARKRLGIMAANARLHEKQYKANYRDHVAKYWGEDREHIQLH